MEAEPALPTSTPTLADLVSQIRTLLAPYSTALSSSTPSSSSKDNDTSTAGGGLSYLPASLPHQLQRLMRQYVAKEEDFLPYAYFPTPSGSPAAPPSKTLPSQGSPRSSRSASSTDTEDASTSSKEDAKLARTLKPAAFSAACAPPSANEKATGTTCTGSYSRNLVDRGNGEYNLLVLCWPAGASSQIHDHPGAHCIVKMLSGRLREVRYRHPDPTKGEEGKGLVKTSDRVLERDAVTYMHDKFGLHSMHNVFPPSQPSPSSTSPASATFLNDSDESTGEPAISLHLYSPPIPLCRVFDPSNGAARVVDCQRVESVGGVRRSGYEAD